MDMQCETAIKPLRFYAVIAIAGAVISTASQFLAFPAEGSGFICKAQAHTVR
jgi:hypothetical protein